MHLNNFVPDKRYTIKRILFVYLFLGGLLLHEAGNACTSVIVSGKATPDGRPLMWKHRDTGTRYNHITFEKLDELVEKYVNMVIGDDQGDRKSVV